ncbi:MAG: IS21 family transposase [Chloroflexi bacterium]|nr:IS21 family transposase [Chloroflexota bacterium]
MLGVMDIYGLRRKVLVEGQSQRRVAREMGVARDTVRRYLATPVPERQQRQRSSPVLDQVRPRLEQLLEEWSHRTTAKQRITGRRLQRQLREEGYEAGLTLVLAELREWRRRRAEVYVPLVHRPAKSAQVDFFEVWVDLAGERRAVWLLLFRLMHSGRDFVRLYERQDQLAFLDGHVRALEHFGGVPRRMVYDNLSAAVERVQFPRRRLTERFAALASYYAFEPSFARAGQGHDKSGVESRGWGVRWQVLTPLPRGDLLEHISDEMQAGVDRLAPEQVWERVVTEGPLLRPLPAVALEPRRIQPVSVNRSTMVRLKGTCALDALSRWVLGPERWGSLRMSAWVGVSEVSFQRGAEQVSHPRQRFGTRRVRYCHFLGQRSRKRQALRKVAPELIDKQDGPLCPALGRCWRTNAAVTRRPAP